MRKLILSDNLGMTFAIEKGRSSDLRVMNVCRKIAALAVACRMQFRVRWIPLSLMCLTETHDAGLCLSVSCITVGGMNLTEGSTSLRARKVSLKTSPRLSSHLPRVTDRMLCHRN